MNIDFAEEVKKTINHAITQSEMIDLGEFINAEELYLASVIETWQVLNEWMKKEKEEEDRSLLLH